MINCSNHSFIEILGKNSIDHYDFVFVLFSYVCTLFLITSA